MNKRLLTIGLVFILIGLLMIFFGFLFSKHFFLFDYTTLYINSKSVILYGLYIFIFGAAVRIAGLLLKEKPKPKLVQKEEEVYSGVCPVCHQEFLACAEIKNGYYVFNCNKCNSKLRVKKSTYYPAG